MNKLIFLLSLVFSLTCAAQDVIFTFVDEMPSYGKNKEDLSNFLIEHLEYPDDAYENNIQGKVVVRFVVNEDSILSDIVLLKGVCPSINNEAMRVVKSMSKWNPGKQNKQLVKAVYTLPIVFSLNIPVINPSYEWTLPHEPIVTQSPPTFPGGADSLNLFIWNTLTYPSPAKEDKIEGMVTVSFQIDSTGTISNPKANNLGWLLTEEALRVVELMPKWTPGTINQKPSPAEVTIQITFIMNRTKQ